MSQTLMDRLNDPALVYAVAQYIANSPEALEQLREAFVRPDPLLLYLLARNQIIFDTPLPRCFPKDAV